MPRKVGQLVELFLSLVVCSFVFSYQENEWSVECNLTQMPLKDTLGLAVNLNFPQFTKDQSKDLHENCSIKKKREERKKNQPTTLCQDLLF